MKQLPDNLQRQVQIYRPTDTYERIQNNYKYSNNFKRKDQMLNIQIVHDKCVEYYNWIEY